MGNSLGRGLRGIAAGTLALGLIGLVAAPATAAEPVATGEATAVRIELAGTPADSGAFTATHDGERESTTGNNTPVVQVLGGQSLLTAGTLAQDATTGVDNGVGYAAACSGLAGVGATLVEAGDGECLTGGQSVRLSAGTLSLTNLTLVQSELLQGVDAQLQAALKPLLDQALPAVENGLKTALTQLGDPGVFIDLGAVQSYCSATPDQASGNARLVGTGAYVQLAGQRIDLVSLPVDPPPNTQVVTDLGAVVETVTAAVRQQLSTTLNGTLQQNPVTGQLPLEQLPVGQQLDQAIAQIQEALITNVISQLQTQLAPLEQNVLDITLNAQNSSGPGNIEVVALDLRLLPAAAAQLGSDPFRLQLGRSACDAGNAIQPAVVKEPKEPKKKPQPKKPKVPVVVNGGVEQAPQDGPSPLALLAVVVTALAVGGITLGRPDRPGRQG